MCIRQPIPGGALKNREAERFAVPSNRVLSRCIWFSLPDVAALPAILCLITIADNAKAQDWEHVRKRQSVMSTQRSNQHRAPQQVNGKWSSAPDRLAT